MQSLPALIVSIAALVAVVWLAVAHPDRGDLFSTPAAAVAHRGAG